MQTENLITITQRALEVERLTESILHEENEQRKTHLIGLLSLKAAILRSLLEGVVDERLGINPNN
jgi:hypothetical protein